MELSIRPARAGDHATIRESIRRARLDRTGINWRNFKVAEDETGQMVGFCQIRHYWGVKELGSLYVHGPVRGRGTGGKLIHACLDGQKPPVHLECLETRQSYYERFGFQRVPISQAPLGLRVKSTVGLLAVWLVFRRRIIVMRWDG